MEISYQISWRQSGSHICDYIQVANSSLFPGEDSLDCQYGCSAAIISPMSYVCTYFSAEDDWTLGEHHITYNFNNTWDDIITVGNTGYAWINAVGGGNWNISTTFSLTKRNDTGRVNSSPRVLSIPPLRLQRGCSYTIPLPVSDPDNDTVRCRWAVGRECSDVCNQLSGATLDANTCTITYTNFRTESVVVAIMIEDFATGSPSRPLSSVALQFVIMVYSSSQSCPSQTDFFNFPSITSQPSHQTVQWNEHSEPIHLTLTCMTNETASYYWERQDGSVPNNSIGVYSDTLTLIDVQPEDTGNYRCAAFANYSTCCRSFSEYAAVTIINGKYSV